ncbi:hypothetical protein BACOVA_05408 [Bacteroides ovatus ATCC 8483]|uniref:Uncharacterized protein n=1 Tax=Bacteroides ovatus (strain ATCC 8483 / DSM 1896 / JCM 5824 / BCRC 10623 / CCUG 4943 / NCTC 11153) TaxID=411476 RepID=A0AAN3D7H0_BACO1|nr:hypothetical protein BACOVA_05408 [Bacteroides ovatus ATCC 8483]
MSCIRIISFWHTVCFLVSVRSRRGSLIRAGETTGQKEINE